MRFARDGRKSGALMLAAAILGLVLANLPMSAGIYRFLSEYRPPIALPGLTMSVGDWARDGLLAIFFLVVGLDLKCELTTGSLSRARDAMVPVLAAIGGVATPALLYLAVNAGSPQTLRGWTVPTATDIAFSVAVLAMAGGAGALRLRPFLTTLAVADDVIGILLIAVVYAHSGSVWALLGLAVCLAVWFGLVRCRRVIWIVAVPIALLAWHAALLAGIHPTIAGVALGLLVPGRPVRGEVRARTERWSNFIGPFSSLLVLPIFAFFAMGVSLQGMGIGSLVGPVFLGVFLGLVVGKPVGVSIVVGICRLCGLATSSDQDSQAAAPSRLERLGVAQLCGIGFTVAFLMADLAFADPVHAGIAKTAVLAGSVVAALIGSAELIIARRSCNHQSATA
ncbi:Na+/H+ antiporter NhaA [Bifidobacterium sp. ESL0690]|uniref:Na+/H+ antiporter NhaA n=1 Tax=Bifidobacterium sp. ESL0690 TaxID=2983214 RepID=UPI0023F8E965|nr:Na+/H+ antiporter NhaA [Bifidobacterium sp. ESL0690]WEV46458.1 Na+/H+ antiporter NhaA [Bifidobacterium sp. ESL0690]